MNAQQRKQAKKQKRLIALGRDAQVEISRARVQVDSAMLDAARKDSALKQLLGSAKTLEEAVALARSEAAKVEVEIERIKREHAVALEQAEHTHQAAMDEALVNIDKAHAAHLASVDSEHDAELKLRDEFITRLKERIYKLETEAEEPAKLRRRLAEKQKMIERLQTEVSRLKQRVAPEPVRVRLTAHRRQP